MSVCLSSTSTLNLYSTEGATVSHDATISDWGQRLIISSYGVIHLYLLRVSAMNVHSV